MVSKSKPSASISFPSKDQEEMMQRWDTLLEDLGTTRSGMVQSVIKTAKVVDSKDLINLASIASKYQNRKFVVFWVPK